MPTPNLHRPLVAILFLLLASVAALRAQDEPCLPDCPQTPFGDAHNVTLTLPNGCTVIVRIAERMACGIYHDVAILSIEPMPGDSCDVYSGNIKKLLDAVTLQLLVDNPMGFPPGDVPDSCVYNWRVVKAGCWREDSVNCLGDTVAQPCRGEVCCLNGFEVCTDSNGVRTVIPFGGGGTPDCDTLGAPECTSVCGDIEMGAAKGGGDEPDLSSTIRTDPHDHGSTPHRGPVPLKQERPIEKSGLVKSEAAVRPAHDGPGRSQP